MNTLQDINVKNKRVIVRCDFNVPLDAQSRILDDFRIKRTLPTIKYLLKQGAKLVLISHLGRPSGYTCEYSLKPVAKHLEKLLGMPIGMFSPQGEDIPIGAINRIILLENLRFLPGEEQNDPDFAAQLAELGDVYVNDGFSVCHRSHASVVRLPKLLPSAAGLLLQSEVKTLSQIIDRPKRPFVVIIGGVKAETKRKLINKLRKQADHLLLGSKIAGRPGFDIGPKTIKQFSECIKSAKTVLWSGPLGKIEDKRFIKGSLAIAKAIIKSSAFSVVGGGDTNAFLAKHRLRERFNYVSTGGGAMLSFLAGEKLPGLQALNYARNKKY